MDLFFGESLGQAPAAARQVNSAKRVVFGQVLAHQQSVEGVQRGYPPGVGPFGNLSVDSAVFEKTVDCRQIDGAEIFLFTLSEKVQEKGNVGGIGKDTVFRQTPLGDQVVEMKFLGSGEMIWKSCSFDGFSAVHR